MQLSSKERRLAILGFLATAGLAYSFGRMTNYLGAPLTPAAGQGAAGAGSASGPGGDGSPGSAGASHRNGSAFAFTSADDGSPSSRDRVTGGQPLDEWLKKLMAQDDDLYRMQNLMKLIETLNTPEDLKTALDAVGTHHGHFSEYGLLMEKFAKVDPHAALAYATSQDGREKMAGVSTALRTWTKSDPAAALAWAQSPAAAALRDLGRGQGGPGGADGRGGDKGQPKENFALASVITELSKTDLNAALTAVASPESGRPSGRVVDTLASEMVSQRGADAARQAVDAMPDGDLKNGFLRSLAGQLAEKDAAGTAKWALSWPAGDTKSRALGEVMDQWAKADPTAAGTFLAAQPASADTDSAREHYATQVVRKDPPGALSWAATITDPAERDRTEATLARDWSRRDPAAATQWLAQSSLPNDLKAKLAPTRAAAGNNRRTRGR